MAEVFERPEYAAEIARDLLYPGPLKEGLQSGVYLLGDRRLGKTTFFRHNTDRLKALNELTELSQKLNLGYE